MPFFDPIIEELRMVRNTMHDAVIVDLPQLSEPLRHVMKQEGKQVRSAITLLAGMLHRYAVDRLIPMAAGVEFIHIASLLHDDTVDNASIRRGEPTVNSVWGKNTAILIGDYIFAKSAHLIAALDNTELMSLFAETLMSLCNGVLEESSSAYTENQNRHQYFNRIENKTASLIVFAAQSGAMLSDAPEEIVTAMKSYGYNLGMAFQIVDDILDFIGDEAELGKPVGNDLFQGLMTLPAILFAEQHPNDTSIKELFEMRNDEARFKKVLDMILSSPVIEQSYDVAREFCSQSRLCLKDIPDSTAKRSLLALVDYVIERKK